MALRIRRGTNAQRTGKTFEMGEIVYTTDAQQMWVGDGSTSGGIPVVGSNVAGYGLMYNSTSHKIEVAGLSADDLTNGTQNKFFSTELAQDAAASLFTTGSHSNISFQYNDVDGKINATVTLDGIGLTSLSADTNPSLGGDLNLDSYAITGNGDIDFTGTLTVTGNIVQTGNLTTSGSLLSSNADVPDTSRAVAPLYVGLDAHPTTLWVKSNKNFAVLNGITDGSNNSGILSRVSRGTLTAKTALHAGDAVTFIEAQGWDGSAWTPAGAMLIGVDPAGTVSAGSIPGFAGFILQDGTGGTKAMTFSSKGVLNAPILDISGYTTGSEPANPQEGWVIFNSTTKQFLGYNGTSWIVLG